MKTIAKVWVTALASAAMLGSVWASSDAAKPAEAPAQAEAPATKSVKLNTTADHTKFKELQRKFASGPEVTKACLTCHTEAAGQIHRTKHWKWDFKHPETGQSLGKKNVANNFCIATASNEKFCASCHVGYGYADKTFDFTKEENVDCLVCHDTTGIYKKPSGFAGHPLYKDTEMPKGSGRITKAPDLTKVAQKVGKSSRDNCGACHFFGGGGDGVKHGDLDSSLEAPDLAVDVHMSPEGQDFTCATCHKASAHDVTGSRYDPNSGKEVKQAHIRGKVENSNVATCQSCHGTAPHKGRGLSMNAKLNDHTDRIACQTCHIPALARGGVATKTKWDWSTAGKLTPEGKPIVKKDDHGHVIYDSKKGDFELGENVIPEYKWFNGDMKYTLTTDKIDPSTGLVEINHTGGSADDGKSLIWPFKVMKGKQPYDTVHLTLLKPHVAPTGPEDKTAFWTNFDWTKALKTGTDAAGQPFSGKHDFIATEMSWPIAHMVAPKNDALKCQECHAKGGRLEKVQDVYIPGRDGNGVVNFLGWLAIAGALGGVSVHGLIRFLRRNKH
ncbi:MAG: hypothetical protein RLZZ397_146 [Pseudomonadota bacterium]|jgi:octaheme c-type cytochrome (tetrathionate reductase family)